MDLQTRSFESPVSLRSEDLLGNWRLAQDVYSIIQQTPNDWSCRIGVFGGWGSGKTSLLKFVETQASADGLISFWVNPSQAENADDLWRVVLTAFLDSLAREGVLLEETKAWRLRLFADRTEPIDKIAELNQFSKAFFGFGRAALKEWLRPDGAQLRKLREKIHARRVLVFVDDLDRTDPKLVPILLMGLRDLLDLPGFSFLLAFDEEIISRSLNLVNPAWGDGNAFLDKILDFSISLPATTQELRLAVFKHHLSELCPWMDVSVVEQNSDVLPATPRKLKALLRNLMILGQRVRRHDPKEIQWLDVFFGQIIRLESPAFMDEFLKNGTPIVQVEPYLSKGSGKPSFDKEVDAIVKDSDDTSQGLRSRLKSLLSTWSTRRGFGETKCLGYYAGFGNAHRDITQLEFENLVSEYRADGGRGSLDKALAVHATQVASPESDVVREFLQSVTQERAACLGNAADSEMESDAVEFLDRAREYLDLLRDVLGSPGTVFDLTPNFQRSLCESIIGQSFRWIHFDRSIYQEGRLKERAFLFWLSEQKLLKGLEWVEFLLPWEDSSLYPTGGASAARALTGELLQREQSRIVQEALEWLSNGNAAREFYGPKPGRAVRFCFFGASSPLWADYARREFFGALNAASQNRTLRNNAFELLSCLSWAPQTGFGGNQNEHKQILLTPGVSAALCKASTAQRVSYRFQQRLLDIRRAILQIGIEPAELEIPEWMEDRAKEAATAAPASVTE